MIYRCISGLLFLGFAMALTGNAKAELVFSNVNFTSNSVTFTVNGDVTGTSTSPGGFSLRYFGDIFLDPGTYYSNSWSTSVFDGQSVASQGNTGGTAFSTSIPYSWSTYGADLTGATATNRTVTVTFAGDTLNTSASNPIIHFVWGNGHSDNNPPVLGIANFSSVPEPSSLIFLALGLVSCVCRRRKTSA